MRSDSCPTGTLSKPLRQWDITTSTGGVGTDEIYRCMTGAHESDLDYHNHTNSVLHIFISDLSLAVLILITSVQMSLSHHNTETDTSVHR